MFDQILLEKYLTTLHSGAFIDPKQLMQNLNDILLDPELKSAEIGIYFSLLYMSLLSGSCLLICEI